jgi:hypothetical protein
VFDELWIEDRLYKVKITNSENQFVESFEKKQVLYIDVESEIDYTVEKNLPAENLKSKIFLGYQIDNKRKYLSIGNSSFSLPKSKVA